MVIRMNLSHKNLANAIRFLSVDAVQKANSGHPGMPMGMADVATVLFKHFLKFDPSRPYWPDRDRFILSAGHGSMLLYAILYLVGYKEISLEQIRNFRQLGSKTAGHPEFGHAGGIETTTGPLGQGLANAVGMAISEAMMAARFGSKIVNHFTYVIAGDGCLMEGLSHESISLAGHLKLSKLIVFWDNNGISIDGETTITVSDDQLKRFEASGWQTIAINGHDPKAIKIAISRAKVSAKPTLIACNTIIGFGAPTLGGSNKVHGAPLGENEIMNMRNELNWPHPPFHLPKNTLTNWRIIGSKGAVRRLAWEKRLRRLERAKRQSFNRMSAGLLSLGWEEKLTSYKIDLIKKQPKIATRQASGSVLEVLTAALPELIGGSADLAGSVNTQTSNAIAIKAKKFKGCYIHYGVREHAMAGIMNGIALHGGFIPYGGTFLVFSDYMRPGMRLSALMRKRIIYVLTHDSIGLGEDGPTHQPVETLAALRAIPNLTVFRPCDAVETLECWEESIKNDEGPSGIVLTRQPLPAMRVKYSSGNKCKRGAYVLFEASSGFENRMVSLIASGSEVAIAAEARIILEKRNINTAVISIPSFELFEAQNKKYHLRTLGENSLRVGIEAAVRLGWDSYLRQNDIFIGMSTFGASGPGSKLFEHFGITAKKIVERVEASL